MKSNMMISTAYEFGLFDREIKFYDALFDRSIKNFYKTNHAKRTMMYKYFGDYNLYLRHFELDLLIHRIVIKEDTSCVAGYLGELKARAREWKAQERRRLIAKRFSNFFNNLKG